MKHLIMERIAIDFKFEGSGILHCEVLELYGAWVGLCVDNVLNLKAVSGLEVSDVRQVLTKFHALSLTVS